MARRKPQLSDGELLGGRDAVWAAIRDLHRRFTDASTVLEVAYRARVPVDTARDYMRRLVRAGFLEGAQLPSRRPLRRRDVHPGATPESMRRASGAAARSTASRPARSDCGPR